MNKSLEDMKFEYNYNLNRLNKGCKYCEEHKNEVDRWLPELFKIYNNMNNILEEISKKTKINSEEISKGFLLEGEK